MILRALLVVASVLVAACAPQTGTTLTVFAAASLTEPFARLADRFEAGHAGVTVNIVHDGSSRLATQLVEGATADLFAAADLRTMDSVVAAGLADGDAVEEFATNRLTIAVAPGNPHRIAGLADLGRNALTVVTCQPAVPCGAAAQRLAQDAGVTLAPDSEESDVKSVLNKIRVGEADTGLVYVSDVTTADGEVDAVAIAGAERVPILYPIAVLRDAAQRELAREFVELVRSPAGRRVLAAAGFGLPSEAP